MTGKAFSSSGRFTKRSKENGCGHKSRRNGWKSKEIYGLMMLKNKSTQKNMWIALLSKHTQRNMKDFSKAKKELTIIIKF